MTQFKWEIKRYCFQCKAVERFMYCDNCGGHFCLAHCKREEDGPYHAKCCG